MIPFSGPTCYDVRENDYLAGDETALNEAEKRGLSDSQLDDLLALMNAFTDRHLLKMKDDGAASYEFRENLKIDSRLLLVLAVAIRAMLPQQRFHVVVITGGALMPIAENGKANRTNQ